MKHLMLAGVTPALLWTAAASAQPRGPVECEEAGAGLWSIAPGEDGSGLRSFYNGQVTVVALDLIEPAAAPSGIAIVMPAAEREGEPPSMACWAFTGFDWVEVADAQAEYDPANGLLLTLPTRRWDEERQDSVPAPPLRIRIDLGRGRVDVVGSVNG
jgi:hypothetical protein